MFSQASKSRVAKVGAVLAVVHSLASACSTASRQAKARSPVWVSRIALANLHYRRPEGISADPEAGPGGVDYMSHPLPDDRLDCEAASHLFSHLKLEAVRQCLNSISPQSPDVVLDFRFQKKAQPYLKLEPERVKKGQSRRPACLDRLLQKLRVPREIVFQGLSNRVEGLACYSSGLVPDGPPLFGFRLHTQVTDLASSLPRPGSLKTDQQVEALLLSWVLRPFFDSTRMMIPARVVPDELCRICIGEKNLIRIQVPPVPLWPDEFQ